MVSCDFIYGSSKIGVKVGHGIQEEVPRCDLGARESHGAGEEATRGLRGGGGGGPWDEGLMEIQAIPSLLGLESIEISSKSIEIQ